MRPPTPQGYPGGLVALNPALPVVLLPDVHARYEMLNRLLNHNFGGLSLQEGLEQGQIQLVALGDYPHAEHRAKVRWAHALQEFQAGYASHEAMDQEMAEAQATWAKLMQLKWEYPQGVHLLKGNHENICNEAQGANRSFAKFAWEGEMTFAWATRFWGVEVVAALAQWEHSLPLVALGDRFVASHARPAEAYDSARLIHPSDEVVFGLTWTRPGSAQPGAALQTMKALWGHSAGIWFCGHNPVERGCQWDKQEAIVQFHDPNQEQAILLLPDTSFDPVRDLIPLGQV